MARNCQFKWKKKNKKLNCIQLIVLFMSKIVCLFFFFWISWCFYSDSEVERIDELFIKIKLWSINWHFSDIYGFTPDSYEKSFYLHRYHRWLYFTTLPWNANNNLDRAFNHSQIHFFFNFRYCPRFHVFHFQLVTCIPIFCFFFLFSICLVVLSRFYTYKVTKITFYWYHCVNVKKNNTRTQNKP